MALDLTRWIELGDVEGVRLALRKDLSLVSKNIAGEGDQALHIACWQKQLAIVELVLSHRPDVNAPGDFRRDQANRDVEEAGLSELDDSLDEVRALLRSPRPLAAAIWQPLWQAAKQQPGNVGFCFGPLDDSIAVKPRHYEGQLLDTSIEIGGQALQTGFGALLSPDHLRRFRDELRSVVHHGSGVARFDSGGADGLRIEVHANRALLSLRDSYGRTFHVDYSPEASELADLLRQVEATCAAWSL